VGTRPTCSESVRHPLRFIARILQSGQFAKVADFLYLGGIMKKNFKIIAQLAISIAVLSGCSSTGQVSGSITIPSSAAKDVDACMWPTTGNSKYPENVYPDIDRGTPVELRNSSGDIVGIGSLGQGKLLFGWSASGTPVYSTTTDFTKDYCVFPFTLEGVNLSDEIYSIEVGTRGQVNFTKQELLDGPSLSLGN